MKKLLKDSEGNVFEADVKFEIPDGFVEVLAEDYESEELKLARTKKMSQIRSRRDLMLLNHDRQYLIALKDSADTTDLLADRQILLNVPQDSETYLNSETDLESIKSFDPFPALELVGSYE